MHVLRVNGLLMAASFVLLTGCNPTPTPKPSPTPTPRSGAASTASSTTEPQGSASITPSANEKSHSYSQSEILTCTVSECWQLGGKTEDGFFDIVQQLAVLSADHRHLVLPESEEAGKKAGEYIKAEARKDRGQLLYAVVDGAVRKVGTPAGEK